MNRVSKPPVKVFISLLAAVFVLSFLTFGAAADSSIPEAMRKTFAGTAAFSAPAIGSPSVQVPDIRMESSSVRVSGIHWEKLLDTGYSAPYTDTVIHKGNYILCATFSIPADSFSESVHIVIDGVDWTITGMKDAGTEKLITAASPAFSATGYEPDHTLPADSMSTIIIIVFSVMGAAVLIAVIVTLVTLKRKNKNDSQNGEIL